jgi:hypothetical protein
MTAFRSGEPWSREETVLAYRLYCELPFGQLDHRHQRVIALANSLGRTPNSVALRLSNLASLDPALQARGIRGMTNASTLDREVASAFARDWDGIVERTSERWLSIYPDEGIPVTVDELSADVPTESRAEVKVRLKQSFFRRTVIASYETLCCICSVSKAQLLVASHIKPWASSSPSERVSPMNGLAMCALHDRAFDRGLLTVKPDLRVVLGRELRSVSSPSSVERAAFLDLDGGPIRLPTRFKPDPIYLAHHNQHVFVA